VDAEPMQRRTFEAHRHTTSGLAGDGPVQKCSPCVNQIVMIALSFFSI
jgi:hypothetical protein